MSLVYMMMCWDRNLGLHCTPEEMASGCGLKGSAVKLEVVRRSGWVSESGCDEVQYVLTFANGAEAHITVGFTFTAGSWSKITRIDPGIECDRDLNQPMPFPINC